MVSDLRDLREELDSAERRIAEMEGRLARQTRNVRELVARHQDVHRAKELLERLRWTLVVMRERQEATLRALHGDGMITPFDRRE